MTKEANPTQEQLWRAETKLTEEKLRLARVATKRARIEFERLQRLDDLEQLSDFHNRTYSFTSEVGKASVKAAIDALTTWYREGPDEPVTIVFDSPGGAVFPGLALFDTIQHFRAQGLMVNTHSIGMAASMGGVLLQAGEKRSIGKHGYILIHEISSGAFGSFSEMEDEVKFIKRLQERILNILAERSTLSADQIKKKWLRRDWWLDAEEALKLGFIDEVV